MWNLSVFLYYFRVLKVCQGKQGYLKKNIHKENSILRKIFPTKVYHLNCVWVLGVVLLKCSAQRV